MAWPKGKKHYNQGKYLSPVSKKGGFQCWLCGNYTNNADRYYPGQARILSMRFIKLLKSNKGQGHFDGVMRPQKPKTFCSECGDPIYDNVDPNRNVVCSNCSLDFY